MKFKPEDFEKHWLANRNYVWTSEGAAKVANDVLEKWLKDAKVVYGWIDSDTWSGRHTDNTHRALLIQIEEIKREPCKHEPKFEQGGVQSLTANTCKHCGVRIVVADWKQEEPFRIEVVPNLANETCQKCGSTEFMVARDMIGTRYCVRCHHTWQPKSKKDGE